MKILTILGTRPEIIRLCRVISKLDAQCGAGSGHVLVHTGQNYDYKLNELFFQQLGVRKPDHFLDARGSLGEQIGIIITKSEKVMLEEKPDRLLLLGDTNSALSAIIAKRLGIPVYHMEAGNRCYDDRVPEEVNRRIIDHSSDILMPYTAGSRANLLREGIPTERIFTTGNPIYEVIRYYDKEIQSSKILSELGLKPGGYFLVTAHRAENVDDEDRLKNLLVGLDAIQQVYKLPVICSLHPRTKNKMEQFGIKVTNHNIRMMEPFGFFDFIALEKNALCVLSDSGTVQEETCILHVPAVTLRDVTERPETLECGSNVLAGVQPERMLNSVKAMLKQKPAWQPPPEYLAEDVSSGVLEIVLDKGIPVNR
jgi:UDP-N-acetylglucosamine 2-epimerase (non-hydrolysing)